MDFFRKGSDPLIFVYGTREAHLSFGHQKGEKHNFPKTPKMAIFKKSCFLSDIVQKGGGGKPESKSFGVVFFGLSFGHFQKFWGIF